jgi:hypothetical protein
MIKLTITLLSIFILSSCTTLPAYKAVKVEYCERINGIVYCEDGFVDTNYYATCSVYDTDCD